MILSILRKATFRASELFLSDGKPRGMHGEIDRNGAGGITRPHVELAIPLPSYGFLVAQARCRSRRSTTNEGDVREAQPPRLSQGVCSPARADVLISTHSGHPITVSPKWNRLFVIRLGALTVLLLIWLNSVDGLGGAPWLRG
jgi:hypothetical protein